MNLLPGYDQWLDAPFQRDMDERASGGKEECPGCLEYAELGRCCFCCSGCCSSDAVQRDFDSEYKGAA